MNRKGILAVWVVVLLLAVPAISKKKPDAEPGPHWVGTWATSPMLARPNEQPPAPGFADSSLRQIVHVSIGGKQIRVKFSNAFGTTPLMLGAAHVAGVIRASQIAPEAEKALTFSGQQSVTIPPGALMVSDPVDFNLAPMSDLAITIYLNGAPAEITTHPASHQTSFLQAGHSVSAPDFSLATPVEHWYFLTGIDVTADAVAGAVVTLGDSITDGTKSTTNGNARWPDDLERRLQANKGTMNVAVLNEGIGGNRLVHDSTGPNALARFDRDVLAQSGVRWVIVLEGINDIGTRTTAADRKEQAATADDLIAAYEQIIARAHSHNIRVFGATILPFEGAHYYTADGEADRQKVNQWIRSSGKFDGVIDLDAVTRNPQKVSQLAEAMDSGDHLHPGDAGYKAMADAIDLRLLAK